MKKNIFLSVLMITQMSGAAFVSGATTPQQNALLDAKLKQHSNSECKAYKVSVMEMGSSKILSNGQKYTKQQMFNSYYDFLVGKEQKAAKDSWGVYKVSSGRTKADFWVLSESKNKDGEFHYVNFDAQGINDLTCLWAPYMVK